MQLSYRLVSYIGAIQSRIEKGLAFAHIIASFVIPTAAKSSIGGR